jgi:hypothetical protein
MSDYWVESTYPVDMEQSNEWWPLGLRTQNNDALAIDVAREKLESFRVVRAARLYDGARYVGMVVPANLTTLHVPAQQCYCGREECERCFDHSPVAPYCDCEE